MKLARKIAIAFIPLALHCASAQAEVLAVDKQKHLGVSFLLGVGAQQLVARTMPDRDSLFLGTALAVTPGLLKELADHRRKRRTGVGEGFSYGDLVADGVGAFAGAFVAKYVSDRLMLTVDRDVAGGRRYGVSYSVPLN